MNRYRETDIREERLCGVQDSPGVFARDFPHTLPVQVHAFNQLQYFTGAACRWEEDMDEMEGMGEGEGEVEVEGQRSLSRREGK